MRATKILTDLQFRQAKQKANPGLQVYASAFGPNLLPQFFSDVLGSLAEHASEHRPLHVFSICAGQFVRYV